MKIIDLLNKIANGEEVPKNIKFKDRVWTYDINNKRYFNGENLLFNLLEHYKGIILNGEVEILEEEKKIPEKLDINLGIANMTPTEKYISNAVNEIIDYLKYLKSKGDE